MSILWVIFNIVRFLFSGTFCCTYLNRIRILRKVYYRIRVLYTLDAYFPYSFHYSWMVSAIKTPSASPPFFIFVIYLTGSFVRRELTVKDWKNPFVELSVLSWKMIWVFESSAYCFRYTYLVLDTEVVYLSSLQFGTLNLNTSWWISFKGEHREKLNVRMYK